ncbi:MAG: acyl-CoA reductase [Chitinophagaceae bacterium]
MNLPYRVDLLVKLGEYMLSNDVAWQEAKYRASVTNSWFLPEFIDLAAGNIAHHYLQRNKLEDWLSQYDIPGEDQPSKTIGIVMAGNLPMVGFHDMLCVFVSGHRAMIKLSSKDDVLIRHLVDKLVEWETRVSERIEFATMLRGCDAYIATGSNNTSRYFDYYFAKYPHIIRRNRSSMAVLTGNEDQSDLEKLADDVYQFFGLGCRNVTKLMVPEDYDFVPLLDAFSKYHYLADHNKYKNNYDYNLALFIMNKQYYMTNGSILLIESPALFSPISQLNYEFYKVHGQKPDKMEANSIQCVVGSNFVPFGQAQVPTLADYADGVDTLNFLLRL